jgi:hypothetical protein
MDFGLAMLWFSIAYAVVTLTGVVHAAFLWRAGERGETVQAGSRPSVAAYARTIPYHPAYSIVVWPIYAYVYLAQVEPDPVWHEAFALCVLWLPAAAAVDLIARVLIKHPWRMTYHELYVDCQPWITLVYAAVFVGPIVGGAIYAVT